MEKRLNTKEAAEYLGVKESTLLLWCRNSYISYYNMGNSYSYLKSDLDKYLASCRREAKDKLTKKKLKNTIGNYNMSYVKYREKTSYPNENLSNYELQQQLGINNLQNEDHLV